MKCSSCGKEFEGKSIFCQDCNAIPKSSLKKEEIENIANDILKRTFEKAIGQLADDFYRKCEEYLYEHEDNHRNKIMQEALDLIIGKKWARYRDDYDIAKLRAKIYKEHKEEFDKKITEQVVEEEIKRYFDLFLIDSDSTGWEYKDLENKIVTWLCENYNKSKVLKKELPAGLIKENERLKKRIDYLQSQLKEIENISGGE